jgi:hypothetical protein
MQYACGNEDEDVLRVLAFDNTIMNIILEIGTGTSSLAKLRDEGFDTKEILDY